MTQLTILSGPEGWDFEFHIANGVLRVLNLDFPHQLWDIPIDEPVISGQMKSYQSITPSEEKETLILTLLPRGKVLCIRISGLIPDERLEWQVPLQQFNRLLIASKGQTFEKLDYFQLYENPPGGMYVDFGPE